MRVYKINAQMIESQKRGNVSIPDLRYNVKFKFIIKFCRKRKDNFYLYLEFHVWLGHVGCGIFHGFQK